MCFSAEVSYMAAAVLLPAGAVASQRAYRTNRDYLPIAALPFFFGLQQLFEGLVWTGSALSSDSMVQRYSMAYMFFSWLAWPVLGSVLDLLPGAVRSALHLSDLCHHRRHAWRRRSTSPISRMRDGWSRKFSLTRSAIRELCSLISLCGVNLRYAIYLFIIVVPLLTSSNRRAQGFGILISIVVAITYLFFEFAYISVFCFGGALMSLYIVYMVFAEAEPAPSAEAAF